MKDRLIKIFIGYDRSQKLAYSVLVNSLIRHSTQPLSITPVALDNIKHFYRRSRAPDESTEFSISRFLVPFLCRYEGWAIYMDCDMLCLDDVSKLWDLRDGKYIIQVVDHGRLKQPAMKMEGFKQSDYPCKNWSSLMLFNCVKCSALTPFEINNYPGPHLHQFEWINSKVIWTPWAWLRPSDMCPVPGKIGFLPREWNYLAGYNLNWVVKKPSMIHYTLGGPWLAQYFDSEYSSLWFDEFTNMIGHGHLSRSQEPDSTGTPTVW